MTLTYYICKRYLRGLMWSLLAVIFLIFLIDGSDQLNFMASNDINILAGLKSTALRSPSILLDAMPLVVMLAGLTTFINLARSSELVIIRSAGRSALRMLGAPIIISLILGIFCTSVGNPLVATSLRYSEEFLENLGLKPRKFMSVTGKEIWLRETFSNKQIVIKADQTNFDGRALYDMSIFEFDGEDTLIRRISARKGILSPSVWKLEDVTAWTLNNNASIHDAIKIQTLSNLSLDTSLTRSQILDSFADPKAINFWALPSFIKKLEASGFSALRHKVFFQSEISRPLFFVAMLLIGASFALRQEKFGQTGILILLSVSCGFLLFAVKRVAESLGAANEISLAMATFAPSVSGILLAVGFLLHLEDG